MTIGELHLLMIGAMAIIIGIVVEIDGHLRRRKRRRQGLEDLDGSKLPR